MASPRSALTDAELHQDRGNKVQVFWYTIMIIATITVALRFWVRHSVHAIGADDWVMLAALVGFLVDGGTSIWVATIGGFKHLSALSHDQISHVLRALWMNLPFGIIDATLPKAAIGLMIIRIIGNSQARWQKIAVYFLCISVFTISAINVVIEFAQCDPPRALWTPGLKANCWNPHIEAHFAIFQSSYNAFVDLCLALIPITIIMKLNIGTIKRLGLVALLGLGIFTCAVTIIKTTYLANLANRPDQTWASYPIFMWAGAEEFLLIFLGSMPPLKPLFDRFFHKEERSTAPSYELPSTSRMKDSYQAHSKGIDYSDGSLSSPTTINQKTMTSIVEVV